MYKRDLLVPRDFVFYKSRVTSFLLGSCCAGEMEEDPGKEGKWERKGADVQDLTQDELLGHGNHVYGARPREEGWL